ncbi:MAG: DUF615 domain-containing protein, partial [Desulfovibrio sp.]|nr:DUF615 domain-containing protein [Desulfovibrio sp.]
RTFSSHEARRRQMQFIGKLMRSLPPEQVAMLRSFFEGRGKIHQQKKLLDKTE